MRALLTALILIATAATAAVAENLLFIVLPQIG